MYNPYEDYKKIREWFETKDENVKKQDVVDALRRFADFLEEHTEDKQSRF